jgi:GxxExxY protein
MEMMDLTEPIIGAAFAVSNELGCGFLESIYENSLLIALNERGLEAANQVPLEVEFHKKRVGLYYADILVNQRIILEIKAVSDLRKEHEAQLLNYLKATGISVGLLINFGRPRLQYRRFQNRFRI